MKRLRLPLMLALAATLVVLVPLGAQNAPAPQQPSAAKRGFELDDILSFRALGAGSLSPNGQWYSYSLAPLRGDREVIIRSTSGSQEWKFQVGETGSGATFSDDGMWAALTVAPTRAQAQANTRARRPNQNSVTVVNLSNGEKTTIDKIQRFSFAGEAGGWIALHRYGPQAAGAGPALPAPGGPPVPPPPGGGRGGGEPAAPSTAARGRDLILRDLKTGTELSIVNFS
jgi:hypothetical protein